MNELIVTSEGVIVTIGDGSSVADTLAEMVKAATIPATHKLVNGELVEDVAEIIPEADALGQEVDQVSKKTHPWRLIKIRGEMMDGLLGPLGDAGKRHGGLRGALLDRIDSEIMDAQAGKPRSTRTKENSAAEKQVLRDIKYADVQGALDLLTNTDDVEDFIPPELQ